MRVRAWAASESDGCWWYRLQMPLTEMAARGGHEVDISCSIPVNNQGPDFDALAKYDIFVGQRIFTPGASDSWRKLAKAKVTKLVYEVDDDLLHIPSDNPSYRTIAPNADLIRANLKVADAVTCSTPRLASILANYNDNVFVVPNCVPAVPLRYSRKQPFTLGWTGSPTHFKDLRELLPQVQYGVRKHGWRFKISDCVRLDPKLNGQVTYLPWENNIDRYYEMLDFDLGICPLADTPFNRSKSWIKALELMARGIPVLASNREPYRDLIEHGKNGYLVYNGYEAVTVLERIARDKDLREELRRNALATAEKWAIKKNWQRWQSTYRKILEQS